MKVAIIENSGKDFYISRIRLAKFLKTKGCFITCIVPNDGFANKIKNAGFEVLVVGQNIRGKGVSNQLKFSYDLYKILKNNDFDVVHCFRMQPNIIGGFIGGLLGLNVYNHITGLGILFTKTSFKFRLQKYFVKFCYKFNNLVFKTKYIFQNEDDVVDLDINRNFKVVKGSAVNEDVFYPNREIKNNSLNKYINSDFKTVLFVSRLVKSKGLNILFKSIKGLNHTNKFKIKLLVVGWIDPQNIDSHSQEEIDFYNEHDFVHILGERKDICDLITISDVCILPTSYREGTPRFMLESMACAKPIITTDRPGCSHLINKNGVLVKPNSIDDLNKAISYVMRSDKEQLGKHSWSHYHQNFSENIVYNSIYDFYLV